jgi:hypothetical protein
MRKSITGLIAAAVVATTMVTLSTPSEARWRGHGWGGHGWGGHGWGVGAGVLGGLAAGAIIAGTYPRYGYYGPGPYYAYGPGPYYARGYYGCYNRRVWTPYGWRWRRFC